MKRKKRNKKPANSLVKVFGAIAVTAAISVTAFGVSYCEKAEAAPIMVRVTMYDVPIDIDLLDHIKRLCRDYEIPVETVLAVIERESNYQANAVGDGGNSKGLMQIQERWHKDRMDKLGVTDLFDPAENVTVGVDFLAYLLEKYNGDEHKALTAYCFGENGANRRFFSKGIHQSDYSRKVLETAQKIKKGMVEMYYTDDPEQDFNRWDAEQQAEIQKLPECADCGNPVQDDHYYLINDEVICPDCLEIDYKKAVEDYVG